MQNTRIVRSYEDGSYIEVVDSTDHIHERSIRYRYKTDNNPARTSPEIPMGVVVDIVIEAIRHDELSVAEMARLSAALNQLPEGEYGSAFIP